MKTRLTMRFFVDAELASAQLEDHSDLLVRLRENRELREKIKVFEAVVWFPMLQKQVNGTNARGMEGTCRGIKVMTWCCAGRCLLQLERNGHQITLITADDEAPWNRDNAHVAPGMGPMGLQGIDAEFLEALVMLYEVTRYGAEITLVPNDNVTIG